MMLRNKTVINENVNAKENHKGEKRTKISANNVGPEAKRIALTDISQSFSNNVLIDSTKKTYDQKPKVRMPGKQFVIKEDDENLYCEKKPSLLDIKPVKAAVVDDVWADYDFDKECAHDFTSVSEYAWDIFMYYKIRQSQFPIDNYLRRQRHISPDMRAMVINWLVGVQEQFELNHETLYLAVKILDLYLDKTRSEEQFELNHETLYLAVKILDLYLDKTRSEVKRRDLQLIGGTAVFLVSKYDERVAPLIDDILFLCDDSYKMEEVLRMELVLYNTVGYDLGVPLSYRFLRRFSRVIKGDMATLTLARYILETSLMFYEYVGVKDDLMAAGALLLALRMKKIGDWDFRLVKYSGYTGYTLDQVEPLMWTLNHMIIKRKADYDKLETIYLKYSHEIFFEVALTNSLPDIFPLSEPIQPPPYLSFH
uniref:G2/mitotic-specific cyclin-B3 n=1 Tax=Panagrolaimus sp. JU765 TaxID=591449 RepID=A0AC34QUV0_9BILA